MTGFLSDTQKFPRSLKTADGRTIPFSILSSGQQELLPLWLVIDGIFGSEHKSKSLVIIEEPEAHLFPSSQADVTNYLASLTTEKDNAPSILITTHSPYVLANINNLVKAGTLASKIPAARAAIGKVVPKDSWLQWENLRAYALLDGESKDIRGDELIDAEYLDGVSGTIAQKFQQLLEIEIKKWPSKTVEQATAT